MHSSGIKSSFHLTSASFHGCLCVRLDGNPQVKTLLRPHPCDMEGKITAFTTGALKRL